MTDNLSDIVSDNSTDPTTKKLADPKSKTSNLHNQNSWYAKLHPIGTDQQTVNPKRLLNLSIFFRIWLAVALVLIICGIVVFTQLFGHVKPTAQQVIEDTLLDTSKLLAANLQLPLQSGQLASKAYQQQLDSAFIHVPNVIQPLNNDHDTASRAAKYNPKYEPEPAYRRKAYSSFRVYVTDHTGVVIYDSLSKPNNAEGQDYSRWNDVYLTLKGQYGARSTPDINSTRDSSIMYVAQPINDVSGQLIGVVSVGKPIDSVLPYLDTTRRRMLITMLLISIVALILAGLVAWWLKQSITLVTHYTSELAEQTKKPYFYLGHELNSLTDTIESMKHRLENRAYVSDYVHTLTHELKSPLTAINASAELLRDDLPAEDRQYFAHSIGEQARRLTHLVDQMLLLSRAEQHNLDLQREPIHLAELFAQLKSQRLAIIRRKQVDWQDVIDNQLILQADRFWFTQMLGNLLDNALDFINDGGLLQIQALPEQDQLALRIFNSGQLIPEFALEKVREAYFSLPRPGGQGKRSSGLGLTLVDRIVTLHGGAWVIGNQAGPEGVFVSIRLPLGQERVRAVQTR